MACPGPNGRRRYRASDCDLLQEVQRLRATGMSLPAAMARAGRPAAPADASIFATCRRRHPSLAVHRLPKRVVLALSRAIEDECCASALRPLLMAAFQRPEFYEASRTRWVDLARTASVAVALADFSSAEVAAAEVGLGPVLVGLDPLGVMLREWTLICYAPDRAALLSGWELPGQAGQPDRDRCFELVWSVDAVVVRDAALAAAGLVAGSRPDVGARMTALVADAAAPASEDLRRAAGLLDRTFDYLSR
jgi:DICT domain-containing protein